MIDLREDPPRQLDHDEALDELRTWPALQDMSDDQLMYFVWLLDNPEEWPWTRIRMVLPGAKERSEGVTSFSQIDESRALTPAAQSQNAQIAIANWPPATYHRWEIRSLDVWGNADDGFEINNLFRVGKITFEDGLDDAEIIEALIAKNVFTEEARTTIKTDPSLFDESLIVFVSNDDEKPVLQLYREDEALDHPTTPITSARGR